MLPFLAWSTWTKPEVRIFTRKRTASSLCRGALDRAKSATPCITWLRICTQLNISTKLDLVSCTVGSWQLQPFIVVKFQQLSPTLPAILSLLHRKLYSELSLKCICTWTAVWKRKALGDSSHAAKVTKLTHYIYISVNSYDNTSTNDQLYSTVSCYCGSPQSSGSSVQVYADLWFWPSQCTSMQMGLSNHW